MARWSRLGVLIAALVLFNSTAAHAQASVAGAVKDASGAVLPGVIRHYGLGAVDVADGIIASASRRRT